MGINYAIQDAVVASSLLGPKLRRGEAIEEHDLARVQRLRELPTIVIQTFQSLAQRVVMRRLKSMDASGADDTFTPPAFVRLLLGIPVILALPARLIGFGLWPPHIRANGTQETP